MQLSSSRGALGGDAGTVHTSADADADVHLEIPNKHLAWFGLAFIAFLVVVVGAISLQQ